MLRKVHIQISNAEFDVVEAEPDFATPDCEALPMSRNVAFATSLQRIESYCRSVKNLCEAPLPALFGAQQEQNILDLVEKISIVESENLDEQSRIIDEGTLPEYGEGRES